MKKVLIGFLALPLLFTSCSSDKEDVTTEIDKKGSVEVLLNSTQISPEQEVVQITYKIWKDGNVISERVVNDTVASLGTKLMEVEDENGNVGEHPFPKNYDFFVTVQ